MPEDRVISPEDLERASARAARYEGEAAAMIVNLTAVDPERTAIWEDEERVWRERKAAALDALPLNQYKQPACRRAVDIGHVSFTNSVLGEVPETSAA